MNGCNSPTFGGFRLVSGATNLTLLSVAGTLEDQFYGSSLSRIGSKSDPSGDFHWYAVGDLTGRVDMYVNTLPTPIWSRTGSGRFGETISEAGDWNGDGFPDLAVSIDGDADLAIGAPGGDYVAIVDTLGNRAARPILSPGIAGNFGSAVDIIGDVNGDLFADILVGDADANSSYLFYGGPDATRTSIGNSCNQGSGNSPLLALLTDPVLGTMVSIVLIGATPLSPSVLHMGFPDPAGTPLPGGCSYNLLSFPPPVEMMSTNTLFTGGWAVPGVPIGTDINTLGLQTAFQSLIASVTSGTLDVSNGVVLTLGW